MTGYFGVDKFEASGRRARHLWFPMAPAGARRVVAAPWARCSLPTAMRAQWGGRAAQLQMLSLPLIGCANHLSFARLAIRCNVGGGSPHFVARACSIAATIRGVARFKIAHLRRPCCCRRADRNLRRDPGAPSYRPSTQSTKLNAARYQVRRNETTRDTLRIRTKISWLSLCQSSILARLRPPRFWSDSCVLNPAV